MMLTTATGMQYSIMMPQTNSGVSEEQVGQGGCGDGHGDTGCAEGSGQLDGAAKSLDYLVEGVA